MILLIISLADKPTLESLLKQSFALSPPFEFIFQITVRSGTNQLSLTAKHNLLSERAVHDAEPTF